MKQILLIGYGAMARFLVGHLEKDGRACVRYVLERPHRIPKLREELPAGVEAVAHPDDVTVPPDLVVECAGHEAVLNVVPQFLRRGIRTIVASIGSLGAEGAPERIERAAREGGTQVVLIPGALAGIDALSAARRLGLDSVSYVGSKPPRAWLGTPCEATMDLLSLTEATTIFEGNARVAARTYPKNANVAAMVALAGLGMECTRVSLIADPGATANVHRVQARGAFGEMEMRLSARTLPDNPKTSALAACSVLRAVLHHVDPMVI